jgi:hypothetical protein
MPRIFAASIADTIGFEKVFGITSSRERRPYHDDDKRWNRRDQIQEPNGGGLGHRGRPTAAIHGAEGSERVDREHNREDRTRAFGTLCVTKDDRRARLPLAGVRVAARVADRVAEISVEQKFRNPFTEALEAVYIFPLPGGVAVSAFELKVGGRVIKGIVKERGEARRTYTEAIQQGKRAALLEQDRDDVFTVQVGNLPPGEEVSVRIVDDYTFGGYTGGFQSPPSADGNPKRALILSWRDFDHKLVFSHEASYCPWLELPAGSAACFLLFDGSVGGAVLF